MILLLIFSAAGSWSCKTKAVSDVSLKPAAQSFSSITQGDGIIGDSLALPFQTPSALRYCTIIGWPAGKTPFAPPGFLVSRFADNLNVPRWIYQAPNNDVFVSEAQMGGGGGNDVLLLRDSNHDGIPDLQTVFLSHLNQPFGMLILNGYFYVAVYDGVWRYPYVSGQTSIPGGGIKIMDLPTGANDIHWTRNIIASPDGSKIYVSVGSGSNYGENGLNTEGGRACIYQVNPDGSGKSIYASGLRNPNGMDWAPVTAELWTAVNERDGMGDNLVPDYLTHVVQGGFYGWPYSYFGQHFDPRVVPQDTALVRTAIVPNVQLGCHLGSLGLAFYKTTAFPAYYQGGAFVGQHGSYNKSQLAGYQVAYVPFFNGRPASKPVPFLTGFIADSASSKVYGRPVGVTVLKDGSMLVADDGGNSIWRVSAQPH